MPLVLDCSLLHLGMWPQQNTAQTASAEPDSIRRTQPRQHPVAHPGPPLPGKHCNLVIGASAGVASPDSLKMAQHNCSTEEFSPIMMINNSPACCCVIQSTRDNLSCCEGHWAWVLLHNHHVSQ